MICSRNPKSSAISGCQFGRSAISGLCRERSAALILSPTPPSPSAQRPPHGCVPHCPYSSGLLHYLIFTRQRAIANRPMRLSRKFTRALLIATACALALMVAAGFVAAFFVYYEVSYGDSDRFSPRTLPAIAIALTVTAGMLWWATWAVARGHDETLGQFGNRILAESGTRIVRVLFSFLCAGSAAVLLFVIFQLPSVGQQSDAFVHEWPKMSHGERTLNMSMLHANMALIVVAVATVCIGLPEYIYLRFRRRNARRHYLRAGGATGMVALLAFVVFAIAVRAPVDTLLVTIALWTLLVCPLTAFTFWLIARPDRSAPTQSTSSR